jgi:cytochrome c551/c552
MRVAIVGAIGGLLLAGGGWATEMPALAYKHECNVCHDIDKRVVGPSWHEVSKKYKGAARYTYNGKEYGLEEGLMLKVSKGGSGNWGSMPMPPNDINGSKQTEIRELVRFVLGLAK